MTTTVITSPPVRVGFVLHRMDVAGAEVLVTEIIRSLGARIEPAVFCLDSVGELGERLRSEGVPVVCLDRRPGFDPGVAWRLAAECRSRGIEVLHAHQYTPFFYAAIARMLGAGRSRLIFTEHGRHYPDLVSIKRRLINRALLSRLASEVNAVCGFSARSLEQKDGFGGHRIEVIQNGVRAERYSSEEFPSDARRRAGLQPTRRYVANIARLHPVKDQATLLRAFALVAQRVADVDLLIAGDGPLRPELEQLCRTLGLDTRVHFLGLRSDVPDLLRSADVFVLSSLSEAASLTLLEAMAAGIPAVVTDVGGNREIVREGVDGLLVSRGDPGALARAMTTVLEDARLAAQMGGASRDRVHTSFLLDHTIERHYRVYRRLSHRAAGAVRDPVSDAAALARLRDTQPVVSFVLPVRNDALRLERCLSHLIALTYPADRLEIIVVDNGSSDRSVEVAERKGARVLHLPGVNVAEMRNHAARLARGDVLAFVDADHAIAPRWVQAAVETLADDGVAMVGSRYQAPDDATWIQRAYDALRSRVRGRLPVEWLASGNMAVWRSAFEWLGGFDPSLETCEDVDLCRRARAAGWTVMNDERLNSVHFGDPETLRAVFAGELWRGRDNLRVSLRPPFSLRGLPSILIPVADLALLTAASLGFLLAPFGGLPVSLAALGATTVPSALRALKMTCASGIERPPNLVQAFLVAYTYDLARAFAIVFRTEHNIRQQVAAPSEIRP